MPISLPDIPLTVMKNCSLRDAYEQFNQTVKLGTEPHKWKQLYKINQ